MHKIDHRYVAQQRANGVPWADIAADLGHPNVKTLSSAHAQWLSRQRKSAGEVTAEAREQSGGDTNFNDFDTFTRALTGEELVGLRTLADLSVFFDIDTEVWEPFDFNVTGNTWQNKAKGEPVANLHQYKVRARFRRKQEYLEPLLEEAFAEVQEMLEGWSLEIPEVEPVRSLVEGAHLAEIAIHDAHFGMLSWHQETGEDYDLSIATRDYVNAGKTLVDVAASAYSPERFLYIVGHDISHIDGMVEGKIPVTNRGTPQDTDSRLPKIVRAVVDAVLTVAVYAASRAPVDIVIVRGNHDKSMSFYIGEILRYAFAGNPRVSVQNEPRDLVFYAYGANTIGLTHGETYLRQKDSLPLIMADECPPEMWISSAKGCREIHTGHYHKRMQGGYYPRAGVDESRGIVVRALPGLTATDAWHKEQGYRHRRAATLMVFRKEGGVAGLHEFTP